MLSIIICSVNSFVLERVKKNIAETVGIDYEVIVIDNTSNQYNICKAYNLGGAKATFPFLCFVHEDVQFETDGWGAIICNHLTNQQTGLIGLAGGDGISMVPSTWSIPFVSNEINIIQHYKRVDKEWEHVLKTNSTVEGTLKKVAVLDGVFLCTRKDVFEKFQFDDQSFRGFHGYDIDYSLQVSTRYNAYVTFDILVRHFSEGNPDKQWLESSYLVSQKWKKILPLSIYHPSPKAFNLHHWHSLQVLIKHLLRLQYNKAFILKTFLKYSFTRFFHIRRFLSTFKFVVLEMQKK